MSTSNKRRISYCIVCDKKSTVSSKKICSKGCNFDLCVECLLKSCTVVTGKPTINNIYTKCFICRSDRIYVSNILERVLKRRTSFCCKIPNENNTEMFLIYKNESDNTIGLSKVIQEIKGKKLINYESITYTHSSSSTQNGTSTTTVIDINENISDVQEFITFITNLNSRWLPSMAINIDDFRQQQQSTSSNQEQQTQGSSSI